MGDSADAGNQGGIGSSGLTATVPAVRKTGAPLGRPPGSTNEPRNKRKKYVFAKERMILPSAGSEACSLIKYQALITVKMHYRHIPSCHNSEATHVWIR